MTVPRIVTRAAISGALVAGLMLITAAAPLAAGAAETRTEAQRVAAIAKLQLGDRYVWGAEGPSAFDCSGLVYYVFREARLLERIGDSRKTAAGYFNWFRSRGLASRSNPRPGDLVVYGDNQHMGIYVGDSKVISALNPRLDVRRHALTGYINMRIKAFLHVRLER